MTIYSMSEFDEFTMFDCETWHKHGTYGPITTEALTDLFTRWHCVMAEPKYVLSHPVTGKDVTWTDPTGDKGIFSMHRDTGEIRYQGVKSDSYPFHDPMEWLVGPALEIVEGALTAGAQIISAINLGGGAHCAITISLKNTHNVEGVEIRPFLSFTTGHSLVTAAVRGRVVVVCDNTADQALNEGIRVKHTKNSGERLDTDYKETISRWVAEEDAKPEEEAWVSTLATTNLTDEDFENILDIWTPLPSGVSQTTASKRQTTMRANIREEIALMFDKDSRATAYRGTAMQAYQALSTHDHYEARTRGNGLVTDKESLVMSRHTLDRYFPRFTRTETPGTGSTHDRVLATIAKALDIPLVLPKEMVTV